jgi:hypothetical protein
MSAGCAPGPSVQGGRRGETATLALSLLASALVFAVSHSVFVSAYGSNDDVLRAQLVSGTGIAVRPDEHLLFSNVLLGRVLAALYTRWPDTAWYDAALVLVGALAHGVVTYAGLRAAPGATAFVVYVLWVGASLAAVTILQFTMAGTAAAVAGLLLAGSLVARPARGAAQWMVPMLAALVAWVGALLRPEAFWMALALVAPPCLVLCARRPLRRAAPLGLAAAAAVALAVGAEAYDRHYYRQDAAWADARELQRQLQRLLDVRRPAEQEPVLAEALRRVGWSRNDFRLFQGWFYPDEVLVSRQTVTSLLDTLGPAPDRRGRAADALSRVATSRITARAGAAVLAALVFCWPHRDYRGVLLASVAAAIGVMGGLAFWQKLPSHVWIPVVLFPPAAALALRPGGGAGERRRPRAGVVVMMLAALLLAAALVSESREADERVQARSRFLDSLGQVPRPAEETLLVTWAPTFPYEAAPPFRARWLPEGLRLLSLGWPHRTPTFRETLRRIGVADLSHALASDHRVLLAAPREVGPLLERHLRRHADARVRLVLAADTPAFTVLKAERVPASRGRGAEAGPGTVLESAAPEPR